VKGLGKLAEKQMLSEPPDRVGQNVLARKALV
jgi:hypothetical protein